MGLLRLFLALVVAADHYRIHILRNADQATLDFLMPFRLWLNSGYAVFLFFVVSGFLISYALANKYPRDRAGTIAYLQSRFIRIYPLYWFLYLISAVMFAAVFAPGPLGRLLGLVLVGSDWAPQFPGGPSLREIFPPYLSMAWALGVEVVFYLIAPLVLRSVTVSLVAFVLAMGIRFALVHTFGFHETWTYFFAGSSFMFFLIGHFARMVYSRFTHRFGNANLLGLIFCTGLLSLTPTQNFDNMYFYLAVIAFAFALPHLFEKTKDSSVLNFIGDWTYPLYLFHLLVMYVLYDASFAPFFRLAGQDKGFAFILDTDSVGVALNLLVFLAICVVASIAMHMMVERPLAAIARRLFASLRLRSHIAA